MTDEPSVIHQLANLARLKLTAAEEAEFSEQIPKILAYVDQLKHVDVSTVPADSDQAAQVRDDVAQPFTAADEIINQAPTKNDRFWQVPPVK